MQVLGPDFRNGIVRRVKLRQRAIFRGDSSDRRRDMAIFRLFNMAAAAILDFSNFKFLMLARRKRAELRRRAKFGRNRSKRGRDMAIFFRFFKMAAVSRVFGPPTKGIIAVHNLESMQ